LRWQPVRSLLALAPSRYRRRLALRLDQWTAGSSSLPPLSEAARSVLTTHFALDQALLEDLEDQNRWQTLLG